MRFTKLKPYNTSLNPLAQPPATPQVHPHCQGDPPTPNDHQVQKQLQFIQHVSGQAKLLV